MAEKCFPFNSVNHDRKYKAEDFRAYFAQLIGNGVIYATAESLKVKESEGMAVTLAAGGGFLDGAGYINTTALTFVLDTADGALNRIDRLVIRNDYASRKTYAAIKKGAYSAQPVAADLQRDADAYEIAVADIYVAKGVISITQANITDQRLNSTLCGIVTGVIEQADTTEIFNQFTAYLNEFKATYIADIEDWTQQQESGFTTWETEEKAAFVAWVETIKDILDATAAGHLQNEIETEVARATKAELERFYGMQQSNTEFMPDGSIVTTNNDGVLTVTKEKTDEVKTITETLVTTGGTTYTKITTITPATATTNKIIREEYSIA